MAERMPSETPEVTKPSEEKKNNDPKKYYRTNPDGTVEFIESPFEVPKKDREAEK
jgi:hypothetical protein